LAAVTSAIFAVGRRQGCKPAGFMEVADFAARPEMARFSQTDSLLILAWPDFFTMFLRGHK
jgi:hypothetical protein